MGFSKDVPTHSHFNSLHLKFRVEDINFRSALFVNKVLAKKHIFTVTISLRFIVILMLGKRVIHIRRMEITLELIINPFSFLISK